MTNKNVIEIIDRLMNPNAEKLAYNATEVFTAIVHGYYYIKPGFDTIRFLKRINKILLNAHKTYSKNHADMKGDIPFEAWLLGRMASDMLTIARTMFDKKYYDSQIAKMVMYEKYDESLLQRYMHWLNDEELKCVCEGMMSFQHKFKIFFSDDEYECMMENIFELCLLAFQGGEFGDPERNPLYFFKHLDRATIIDTICEHVDADPILLAHMIKVFKYADTKTAAEYTGFAIWLISEFEQDIFNPKITDMNKINLDDYDYRRSKVIHSNKSGKTMLA